MKYVKIDPFELHLDESLPDHPSSLYFLIMPDPFERKFLAEKIATKLQKEILFIPAEALSKELESPSLFSASKVLIVDEVVERELPEESDSILIITGKSAPSFYKQKEKEAITLDLTAEKPWERKNRLQKWLLERTRAARKILSSDEAAYLLDLSNSDFATLIQELEKVIVYSGEEKTITLQMIKDICILDKEQNGWELSEAIVWGGTVFLGDLDLYALVGQLRYQLQLGLQLSTGKEVLRTSPKKLDKIKASGLDADYFFAGLKDLFDLEMAMRSNISNHALLLDRFRSKLCWRRHAVSAS